MNRSSRAATEMLLIVSMLATLGSLYYSNHGDIVANTLSGNFFAGEGFYPCRLCWWARILMYPLFPLSILAVVLKEVRFLSYYALGVSIVGIILETYHYLLQKSPIITSEGCSFSTPCDALDIDYLGFITIPFQCLVAFILTLIASIWMLRAQRTQG